MCEKAFTLSGRGEQKILQFFKNKILLAKKLNGFIHNFNYFELENKLHVATAYL